MIRAAAAAAAFLALSAHASNPAQDYILNCMGCHGTQAQGIPGKVPALANALSRFMRSPEGRNYVLRVPGAANSALSDQQLADVLNWLAVTYESTAPSVQPALFTSTEVAAVRHQPLLSVLATRSAVVQLTQSPTPADLVLTDGRIYTADAAHSTATAMAVQDGKIVFVGSTAQVRPWIGPATRVEPLGGRLVLPGLVDSHLHPLDIVDLDVCDLESRPVTLAELTDFVRKCIQRYQIQSGQRLVVHQWSYTAGNQPDPQHPTLRAALDAASTRVQIQLLGNDAHHGAFNSLALSQAKDSKGRIVGLSRSTLAGDLAAYKPFVGVDLSGEPNGTVNDDGRYLINIHSMLYTDLDAVARVPEKIPQRLNSVGITAVLDAMATADGMPVYDKLAAAGKLTVRVTAAQFYDPSHTRKADGTVDYESLVSKARALRSRYANNPLIRADFIKLFADGVLEGNPFAVPPTLPNAATLKPFLQPVFAIDAEGHPTVTGYVDTASDTCADVRAHPAKYSAAADIDGFIKLHGHHPAQCAISEGELQHSREIILEYVKRMHVAGFNIHIHAISDRSVRTAVDAIEAARQADGISTTRDGLAHLQLVNPAEVPRIGRDHLYLAFTYAWMNTDPDYDPTVIPFFQTVKGNSYAALHVPGSYYESNSYPVRALKDAGAILVAGSDAPVETRDPRPFVNMSHAVTRASAGLPPLNPKQSIPLRDVIDAYTINGARMLNLQKDAGSLEVGKSADFIILDRDILALADEGHPEGVADTQVLGTWFRGQKVYSR
jgi:predicted amidohydrolase YtcJ/cytochrome c553